MEEVCAIGERERGDSLRGGGDGVHGEEEGQALCGQILILGIELPAQRPAPVLAVLGDPCPLLAQNILRRQRQQQLFPVAAGREKSGELHRVASVQIPGISPAGEQRGA